MFTPDMIGLPGGVLVGLVLLAGSAVGIARWFRDEVPKQLFDDRTDWSGVASGQCELDGASAPGVRSGGGVPGAFPSDGFSRSPHGGKGSN